MSLAVLADHMASKGRGPDSMLIHMSPTEVQGLQALAMKHGGSLTINPETGLPEAGFLDKLLPAIIGFAITATTGIPAWQVGLGVGAVETARTGDLGKGVRAGLGAYGGADLGAGLMEAGASTIGAAEAAKGVTMTPEQLVEFADNGTKDVLFQQQVADKIAAATPYEKLSSSFDAFKNNPMGMAKSLATPAAMAFGPAILADQAVAAKGPQTTTRPGMVRPYSYDPYGGTYTAGTPYEAQVKRAAYGGLMGLAAGGIAGYGDGDDVPRQNGMAQGGMYDFAQRSEPVVRMARGGIAHFEGGGGVNEYDYAPGGGGDSNYSVREDGGVDYFAQQFAPDVVANTSGGGGGAAAPNYDQVIADAYATIGRSGVGEGTNQIDQGGYNHFLNMLQTGQVAPGSFNDVFQGAVTRYIADNPNDRYTQYVNDYRANQTGGGAATATDTTGGLTNLAAANNIVNVTGATTGGTNLAAFNNSYTGANINDYIANNNLDAAGIQAAALLFNVDPAQIVAAQNAQNIVTNVYHNVLGRDPDPAGLSWWTNQIMNGDRTGAEMYESFKDSAKSLLGSGGTKEIFKDLSLVDATKNYGGYQSADKRTIADEWVRNTLGREVTDADRQTQWYKDAANSAVMTTVGKAENIYGKFKDFARDTAGATVAKQINDAKTLLASKGLSEMDVLRQTGKTIAELVGSGIKLENDLFKASQLLKPGEKAGFDFNKIQGAKVVPPVVTPTGNYGNATNPGDITTNKDGTVTVQPNIPYRPPGGFSGIGEVTDAYTKGGGSLGYTSPTYTKEQFKELYEDKLTGGSKQSYDYLRGNTPYDPVPFTKTGEIQKPYWESVGRFPAQDKNKNKKYLFKNGKYELNPDYVKPSYVLAGEKAAALADPDVEPTIKAGEGKKWVWSDEAKKWEAKPIEAASNTTTTGQNDGGGGGGGDGLATGGLAALTMAGGGQFDLGGYSDGGRLLRGPGDGVSDSIPATIGNKRPARLADGEFVVPARIVSELGNGSTEAGARKLYAMMDRVQAARKGSIGKGKVAKNSRADKYLPA